MTPIGSTSSNIRRAIAFTVYSSCVRHGTARRHSRQFGRARAAELIDPCAVPSSLVVNVADRELAFHASDMAADLALTYFEAGVTAMPKADGTPVTEADRAVERLIRETLTAARPEDVLLGEEFGRIGTSDRVWIIDPIDGTSFFTRRDPNWRVQIALEVAGRTELAVVTAPALRRRWWATRGGGAFESSWPREEIEPRRLAVSTTSRLAEARLEALDTTRVGLPPVTRPPSSALPLVELVRGEIDAFLVERYSIWDHAPWILIVEEAGGRFTDPSGGRRGDQGGGVYSNAALHDELLGALQYPARAGRLDG
jgi:histidinol-phosphatase